MNNFIPTGSLLAAEFPQSIICAWYRKHRVVTAQDQFEIISGSNIVAAAGFGFSDPLAHAKELIDAEFETPLLAKLRLLAPKIEPRLIDGE